MISQSDSQCMPHSYLGSAGHHYLEHPFDATIINYYNSDHELRSFEFLLARDRLDLTLTHRPVDFFLLLHVLIIKQRHSHTIRANCKISKSSESTASGLVKSRYCKSSATAIIA